EAIYAFCKVHKSAQLHTADMADADIAKACSLQSLTASGDVGKSGSLQAARLVPDKVDATCKLGPIGSVKNDIGDATCHQPLPVVADNIGHPRHAERLFGC